MSKKKNILFISNLSDVHNIKWISYFAEQDYNVFVTCETYDNEKITDNIKKILQELNISLLAPIPVVSLTNPFQTLKAYRMLNLIVKANQIDLIHVLFGTHALYRLFVKTKFVITTRGSDILIFLPVFFQKKITGNIWKYIYTQAFKTSDFVTCTSYKQVNKALELFGAHRRIELIRTGVDVEKIFNIDVATFLPPAFKNKKIVFAPRYLKPIYNNELIVEAISLLQENYKTEYCFVFIKDAFNDHTYIEKFERNLTANNINYIIIEEISQEAIWACFRHAKLTIMTPLSDGTPNTALEAMAARCPLILGKYDYDPDIFDNVCIRLSNNNRDELKEAIISALNNYPSELIKEAYDRVLKLGNRSIEMRRLDTIYKSQWKISETFFTLRPYQQCKNCILDTNDDPEIYFNSQGICNHCINYEEQEQLLVVKGKKGETLLAKIAAEIKEYGKGKQYDCLLGISGGVDSSYVALIAKKLGLRVLCVHLDNGWNTELAVKNIENIITKLGFDLYTYVLDWEEFKDLQLSYFKASVLDIEVPTDHAMIACLYHTAVKHNIKYVLSGHNVVTEAVLPKNFNYDKADAVNIKAIHKAYGKIPLKTFVFFGQKEKLLNKYFYKQKSVRILNLVDYNKKEAIETLKKELDWKEYGGKHSESAFTKFYQNYVLPEKFKIDKRKAHLSNLIVSGQISREKALEEMKSDIYDPAALATDRAFLLKKLGLSEQEFNDIMKTPPVPHEAFEVEIPLSKRFPILKVFKNILYPEK